MIGSMDLFRATDLAGGMNSPQRGASLSENGVGGLLQAQSPQSFASALQTPSSKESLQALGTDPLESKAKALSSLIEEFVSGISEKFNLGPVDVAQALEKMDPKQFFMDPKGAAVSLVSELPLQGAEKGQAQQLAEQLFGKMKALLSANGPQIPLSENVYALKNLTDKDTKLQRLTEKAQAIHQGFSKDVPKLQDFLNGRDNNLKFQQVEPTGSSSFVQSMAMAGEPSTYGAMSNSALTSTQDVMAQQSASQNILGKIQGLSDRIGSQKGAQAYGFSGSVQTSQGQIPALGLSELAVKSVGLENEAQEEGAEDFGSQNFLASQNSPINHSGKSDSIQGLKFDAILNQPLTDTAMSDENLQNLMQGAQVIAKEGGGEMQLELRPEGLGRVKLKVSVEGDQVQVQMLASNKEAHEFLKGGMEDLKAHLIEHKMNVDSIKVEMASDAKSFDMMQGQSDGRDHQRQFAQGFMQQFRDERDSLRQGFYNIPGRKNNQEQQRQAIEPSQVRSQERTSGRLSVMA